MKSIPCTQGAVTIASPSSASSSPSTALGGKRPPPVFKRPTPASSLLKPPLPKPPLPSASRPTSPGFEPPRKVPTPTAPKPLPKVPAAWIKARNGGDSAAPAPDLPAVTERSHVTNAEFANAIFRSVPEGASPAICSKAGDPEKGGWPAMRLDALADRCPAGNNNFLNCGSFSVQPDGSVQARKGQAVAVHCLLLDDLGTKVLFALLGDFKLSWVIATSPGNHQAGITLDRPLSIAEAEALHSAIVRKGLCDAGAGGPATRWVRMPVGVNGKEKYRAADGSPFHCQLVEWHPERRYSADEIITGLKLEVTATPVPRGPAQAPVGRSRALPERGDSVYTPKAAENPVVTALKECGLYKAQTGPGKHDITCPWVNEHTDQLDNGAAYFEPDDGYPSGGFCCHHSHRDRYRLHELLHFLEISEAEARNKPVIRIVAGEMPRVLDAAERELAKLGFYRSGGRIVSVAIDPLTGDASMVPISKATLTTTLALLIRWEKPDLGAKKNSPCDPPERHIGLINDGQNSRHLPLLTGLARQPYFRERTGELVMTPGYDSESQRFGVFDPRDFVLGDTTVEGARKALATLEDLLSEFHFAEDNDRAAALAAIFTAVVRLSLAYAPAFHVQAPVFGSGKSFLCDLTGCFAGPAGNRKVSYPRTSEEATKAILALLRSSPAVVEFDDMDTDWTPHGVINRMLTAEHISDRILGVSETATVSTRTLFLGSGNNVGPARDLLRRVLTIRLDPRCETPATQSYSGDPVAAVRASRGVYVSAVFTIIVAWRAAGSPRADVASIATYGGEWADYCRHPLIWLGLPDPATALIQQISKDPDADVLGALMEAWRGRFGSTPTTVRAVLQEVSTGCGAGSSDLEDALQDCPITERGGAINPSKFGWFLRKNANRIRGGYAFEKAEADGRLAWRLIAVEKPRGASAEGDSDGDAPPAADDIAF